MAKTDEYLMDELYTDTKPAEAKLSRRAKRQMKREALSVEEREAIGTRRNRVIYFSCIIIVVAMAFIFMDTVMRYRTMQEYAEAEQTFVDEEDEVEEVKRDKPEWASQVDISFDELKAVNKDVFGWIYFENEDISYPMLKGEDNDYYLHHTYTNESAYAGSIFIDYHNDISMDDSHTIIYGHNMKNLTMFGKLRNYRNDEHYYDEHMYFQVILPDKKLRYKVFAYSDISEKSDIYTIYKNGEGGFMNLVDTLKTQSLKYTDVPVNKDDKVVTLSTCSSEAHRLIVNAVLIDEWVD